jgi:glycosyltransferase involved in cell wall biosynthesis
MPWDVPLPLTNSVPDGLLQVFVPLYDSQAGKTTTDVFGMLAQVMEAVPDVRITAVGGPGWVLHSLRSARMVQKQYGDQFTFVPQATEQERRSLLSQSHLVVWPAHYDSFGLVGLTALHMGVPVVAWDIEPQNELIINERNGMLVPCFPRQNWLGMPYAAGKYSSFGRVVIFLLQNPHILAKMRSTSLRFLENRAKYFQQAWKEMLH